MAVVQVRDRVPLRPDTDTTGNAVDEGGDGTVDASARDTQGQGTGDARAANRTDDKGHSRWRSRR